MLYIDCELFIRKSCVLRIDNSHPIYTILTHGSQLLICKKDKNAFAKTSKILLLSKLNHKIF